MLSQPPKTNVKELNKRQRQKAKKKNFARVSRVFVHFFAVVARLQRETSYFLVCGGREHNITVFFFFFWTSIPRSFRIQLQKNSPLFAELNEMEQAR